MAEVQKIFFGIKNRLGLMLQLILGENGCVLCGKKDFHSIKEGVCNLCSRSLISETLDQWGESYCVSCGLPLLGENRLCSVCREGDIRLDNSSLFLYRGVGKDLITFYKFRGVRRLSYLFARLIHEKLERSLWGDFTLVPVPPSKGKIFHKGWDQMEQIVEILRFKYGHSCKRVLKKRASPVQKSMGRDERRESIRGKITTVNDVPQHVLILDDVLTTGATLNECYKALYHGGAGEIKSLSIARDEKKGRA